MTFDVENDSDCSKCKAKMVSYFTDLMKKAHDKFCREMYGTETGKTGGLSKAVDDLYGFDLERFGEDDFKLVPKSPKNFDKLKKELEK